MPEANKPRRKSVASDTEDRRVRRTKRALKEALIELIQEKGYYDDVSVQNVIDRADVGRTSFYTHFKSKEDLLLRSLDDLEDLLGEPDGKEFSPARLAVRFFEHLEENRPLAKALLGSSRTVPIIQEHVREQFRRQFRRALARELKESTSSDIEGTAVFASGALVAMIHWWLERDRPGSRKKVGELAARLLTDGVGAIG